MAACQSILTLQKERARQFQAHPRQLGTANQDTVQRRNRLVQQTVPLLFRDVRLLGGLDRRQGGKKADVGDLGMIPRQGAQEGQGLVEPAVSYQRPRLRYPRLGRQARTILGAGCRNG